MKNLVAALLISQPVIAAEAIILNGNDFEAAKIGRTSLASKSGISVTLTAEGGDLAFLKESSAITGVGVAGASKNDNADPFFSDQKLRIGQGQILQIQFSKDVFLNGIEFHNLTCEPHAQEIAKITCSDSSVLNRLSYIDISPSTANALNLDNYGYSSEKGSFELKFSGGFHNGLLHFGTGKNSAIRIKANSIISVQIISANNKWSSGGASISRIKFTPV